MSVLAFAFRYPRCYNLPSHQDAGGWLGALLPVGCGLAKVQGSGSADHSLSDELRKPEERKEANDCAGRNQSRPPPGGTDSHKFTVGIRLLNSEPAKNSSELTGLPSPHMIVVYDEGTEPRDGDREIWQLRRSGSVWIVTEHQGKM